MLCCRLKRAGIQCNCPDLSRQQGPSIGVRFLQGGESKPDGAADGEEAYSGVTPQAAAIMSAAKCSVKLASMQVRSLTLHGLYGNELSPARVIGSWHWALATLCADLQKE